VLDRSSPRGYAARRAARSAPGHEEGAADALGDAGAVELDGATVGATVGGAPEADGAAELDAPGDPLAPADEDGLAELDADGSALTAGAGVGDGVGVRKPPVPARRP